MGNSPSIQKINFEDMQTAYKNPEIYLLMNTLPFSEQSCLILNTLTPQKEETLMNRYLNSNKNIRIIIYGRHSNDETIYKKYNQLINLGFANVYLYLGGMFEWLMLQDIFGFDDFPTTTRQLDILKYKPSQKLNISYIENG
jgi:rhodanese-related sulfurtransferase